MSGHGTLSRYILTALGVTLSRDPWRGHVIACRINCEHCGLSRCNVKARTVRQKLKKCYRPCCRAALHMQSWQASFRWGSYLRSSR